MKKTVLVTGASSGIGRETALLFKEKGWNVAATMRRPEGRTTGLEGTGATILHLDVTDRDSIREAVRAVLGELGGLDVLINNAGYAIRGAFEAYSADEVRRQFDTNVLGLMDVTREVIPVFRERRAGAIVNVASVGGRVSFPFYSVYNSTKWAVEGYSESLRYELEPFGIRVKVVEPGIIKTDFYDRSMVSARLPRQDAYEGLLLGSTRKMAGAEARGSHPKTIAALIYRAATDPGSRLRYRAGSNSALILGLRKLLPDRMVFALIRSSSM